MSHSDHLDSEGRQDRDAVSRAYRAAREGDADAVGMEPSAALDDAIRAAARRAVHAGPQPLGKSWIRRWTPQLAVAAVVVLSVSLVFVAVNEQPELAPPPVQIALNHSAEPPAVAPPMQTRILEATPSAKVAVDAVKKHKAADAGAAAADAQVGRQKDAALLKEERGSMSPTPTIASPPPAQLTAAASAPAAPVHSPPGQPAMAPAPAPAAAELAPAPFPATVADAVAPARKEARADARSAAVPQPRPAEEKAMVAGALRSRDAMDAPAKPAAAAVVAAPSPIIATPATPAAPVTLARAPMMKQGATATAATPQASGAAAPVRTPSADAARSNTQATKAAESAGVRGLGKEEYQASGKADADERPGPWLKRLLELREQGKLKELREELVRFKKAHPDVVLPKSLTELPPQ